MENNSYHSWYVESLLRDSQKIRANITSQSINIENNGDTELDTYLAEDRFIEEPDLYDDTYNDLLRVEKAINELQKNGNLSELEYTIVVELSSGATYRKVAEHLGLDLYTVSKYFREVCGRVGYLLGGIFTDEGFLDHLESEYKLSPRQREEAQKYIMSNKQQYLVKK